MLHSFCVPEVPGDKQKRERSQCVSPMSVPEEAGRAAGASARLATCTGEARKNDSEFPSNCHGDSICHHSFPKVVLPTCRWSPPFPASRCPWAQKPPPCLSPSSCLF